MQKAVLAYRLRSGVSVTSRSSIEAAEVIELTAVHSYRIYRGILAYVVAYI